jgi:hypothetical protein
MSLTVTYDPVLSRMRLAATVLGASATYAYVWRSTDNFATSTVVRGGGTKAVSGGVANLDDYEFEPGVAITYQITSYNVAGVQQASFTSSPITQDLAGVWLKVPAAPYLNRQVVVQDAGELTRRSRAGLFDVIGRSYPVAVGDIASSTGFDLAILTQDFPAEEGMDYLVASGQVVFLHVPSTVTLVRPGYYSMGDVTRSRVGRLSDKRVWTLPLTEVARPAPQIVGPAYTWQALLAEYGTWSAVIAGNATWAAVMNRVASPSDVIVP